MLLVHFWVRNLAELVGCCRLYVAPTSCTVVPRATRVTWQQKLVTRMDIPCHGMQSLWEMWISSCPHVKWIVLAGCRLAQMITLAVNCLLDPTDAVRWHMWDFFLEFVTCPDCIYIWWLHTCWLCLWTVKILSQICLRFLVTDTH